PVGEPQLGRVLGARAVALQPAEHDAVDRPVVEQPADRPVPMAACAGLLGPPARAPGAVAVQPGLRGFDLRPGGLAALAVRAVDAAAQGTHPGRGPPGPLGRGGRAVPARDLEHPLLGHAVGLLPAFGAPQLRVVRLAPTARLRLRQAPVLRAELRIGLGGLHAQNPSSVSSSLSWAGARSRSSSSRPSAAVASDRAPAGPPLRGGSGARGARSDSRSPLTAPRSIGARWGAVGRGAAPRSSGARGGAGGAVRFSTGSSSRNGGTGRYW